MRIFREIRTLQSHGNFQKAFSPWGEQTFCYEMFCCVVDGVPDQARRKGIALSAACLRLLLRRDVELAHIDCQLHVSLYCHLVPVR